MADAYEVALRWSGDLLRAELYQGAFEIWAGGTHARDLPLPVEGRHLLARADERGAVVLSLPAGAAWTLDGAEGRGATLAVGDSVARLQVADLEIAMQATSPPEPLPRWSVPPGTWRVAAAHLAAYVALAGLLSLPPSAGPPAPARVSPPRPVVLRPFADSGPPPAFVSGHDIAPRAGSPTSAPVSSPPPERRRSLRTGRRLRAPSARAALLQDDPVPDRMTDLATSSLEIASLDDLADPAGCAGPACAGTVPAAGRGRGSSPGGGDGVGTCQREHFQGLVARHGRTAAIVACSPGPRLGSADPSARGDSVVLRDRGRDARLAAEIWVWDGSRDRR